MTEPGPSSAQVSPPSSVSAWGRRAARIYLLLGAVALLAMLVETLAGHPGTGTMFAAILAAPWSMLVAGLAPPLPRDWPMAAGLLVRIVPLALFMLLNAVILRGVAARTQHDLTRSTVRAGLLLVLASVFSSGCILTSRRAVLVAAPTKETTWYNGVVVVETLLSFDLSTLPDWTDHRDKIVGLEDLSLMGDFTNPLDPFSPGAPSDVTIFVSSAPESAPVDGPAVWGNLHLESETTHRVGWNEGAARFNRSSGALRSELTGDGRFALAVTSLHPSGDFGGATVQNFRLGVVLEVR